MSIRIDKVYTRSGDAGQTGLVGGKRVSKANLRVQCYGEVDELNSLIALMRCEITEAAAELHPVLTEIQQQLFDLGSELATPQGSDYDGMFQAQKFHVTALETLCDTYAEGLPELRSFILPGGSRFAASAHVARAVARRAERTLVELAENETVNEHCLSYLNRLSDLFFILARWELKVSGREEPVWVKEAERKL